MAKQASAARLTKAELAKLKARARKHPRMATVVTGVLLVLFLAVIFFILPDHLPPIMLYMLGITNGVLVLLLPVFASKEYGRGLTKRKLPLLGMVDLGTVGGIVLGLTAIGWWLSPLAPIGMGIPSAVEIADQLSEEVALAALAMPDFVLAVIQPPIPPEPLAAQAARIPTGAPTYTRLIKAIAERRYADARVLVERAEREGVDAQKLALVRGQIAVFSGNFSEAPGHFAEVAQAQQDVSTVGQLTVAYALAGDVGKAYASATKLLDGARSGSIGGTNAKGVALNIKAAVALTSGRFTEAIALSEESQIAWETAEDSAYKAASRNNQAVVYAMLPKKFAGAATQFDAALALWSKLYGLNSARAHVCRHNLAVLAMASGDFSTADRHFLQSREGIRNAYGDRSSTFGLACVPPARLNIWVGRLKRAGDLLEQAQKTIGKSPLIELAVDGARGSLYAGQGRYADAAGSLAKARSNGKSLLVPQHPFAADLNIRWAELTVLRAKGGDTLEACHAAIESLDEHMVQKHPLTAQAHNTLGWEQIRRDKKPEAQQHFEQARAIIAANRNETGESLEAGRALQGLARLQNKRSWRDAIHPLRQAVKVEVETFGRFLIGSDEVESVETPRTADYWFDQAVLLATDGDRSEQEQAGALFDQVIALRQRLLPPAHPELAATYTAYAKLLTHQNRKAEAEQMGEKAEAIRKILAEEGGK